MRGEYKYHDILDKLTKEYNSSIHRTIGRKPKDVSKKHEKVVLHMVYNIPIKRKKSRYKRGDKVRISKYKHLFEKGYTPNWTTEIFTNAGVNPSHPVTYLIEDFQGQLIAGSFYEQELHNTSYPYEYNIEKIIKKRGNKLFVKWKGFDDSYNSWINK